jgi:hypothetical protein
LPPPFRPDPDLIDHMEDNQRLIRRWRDGAVRDRAEALRRYERLTAETRE